MTALKNMSKKDLKKEIREQQTLLSWREKQSNLAMSSSRKWMEAMAIDILIAQGKRDFTTSDVKALALSLMEVL